MPAEMPTNPTVSNVSHGLFIGCPALKKIAPVTDSYLTILRRRNRGKARFSSRRVVTEASIVGVLSQAMIGGVSRLPGFCANTRGDLLAARARKTLANGLLRHRDRDLLRDVPQLGERRQQVGAHIVFCGRKVCDSASSGQKHAVGHGAGPHGYDAKSDAWINIG